MKLETSLVEKYGIFMDLDDLADLLKIKRKSIYQQIYHGKLQFPHFREGKKYLFESAAVAKYLEDKIE